VDGVTEIELFRTANLAVRQVGDSGDVCFVTFDSHTRVTSLDRPGFGEGFLRGEGIAAIHVLSRENRWYQLEEMAAALAAVAEATQRFSKVVTYGSSMGGYAAMRFARACGAQLALAISPQFTIDPRRPPFDRRWRSDARRIRFVEPAYAAPDSAFILFDPDHVLDRAQARQFIAAGNTIAVPVRFGGHPVSGLLAETGTLQMLVRQVAAGAFDPQSFRRQVHALRRDSAQYYFVLAHRLQYRRPEVAAALLRRALAIARQPSVLSTFGTILDREGAFDAAEPLHLEALQMAPDDPDSIALHAWHLALRGRVRDALRSIDETVRERAILRSPTLQVVRMHLIADRLTLGLYFRLFTRFAKWRGAPLVPSREFWQRPYKPS